MKRPILFSILLASAAAVAWFAWHAGSETHSEAPAVTVATKPPGALVPNVSAPELKPTKSAPPASVPGPQKASSPAPRPNPPVHPLQDTPARLEAEAVALNLRHFGQRFGGNPVGTNAEIVKVLNGGNPQGVRYLPQEALRLNAQGELLDHFGTPYFFHQMSATEMEVRSAGEDRLLWTADDIVVK